MPDLSPEKERINIAFKSKVKGGENVNLPLRMLVVGRFNPTPDLKPDGSEQSIGERRKWRVDKDTFNQVMSEMGTTLVVHVADKLHEGAEDAMLPVKLRFRNRDDFAPNRIIDQVEYLRQLRDIRDEVKRLTGEMTKKPDLGKDLAKILTAILNDPERAEALLKEREREKAGAGQQQGTPAPQA